MSVDLRLTATASAQARTVAEAGTLNSAFRGASFLDGWHPDKSRRRLPDYTTGTRREIVNTILDTITVIVALRAGA